MNLIKVTQLSLFVNKGCRLAWLLVSFALAIAFLFGGRSVVEASPSLIAYWHLDETGAPYEDSSENGLLATCGTCPIAATGIVSQSQLFNGTTTTLTVTANSHFDWAADDVFSIALWVKPDNGACTGADQVFIGRGTPDGGHWALGCSNGTAFFSASDNDTIANSLSLNSNKVITTGVWHHITAVYDGGSGVATLSVDYTDTQTVTINLIGNLAANSADLHIGHLNNDGHFAGRLDEIAFYQTPLGAKEKAGYYYLARRYTDVCASDIRIMPLGDSITAGTGTQTGSLNTRTGYRKPLYLALVGEGIGVDFVGSQSYGDGTFDQDNESAGGRTAASINSNIISYLNQNPADVVLLHIGTNDLKNAPIATPAETAARINEILNKIEQFDPKTTVILAQIINQVPNDTLTTELNNILGHLIPDRVANGSKIILVNMETDAGLVYATVSDGGDMFDSFHPAHSGYEKMADLWHATSDDFLSVCAASPTSSAPQIVSTPVTTAAVNETYTYQVVAIGDPPLTFGLNNPPTGMTIDGVSGLINWTPLAAGSFAITATVENDFGADAQQFNILVNQPGSFPNACLPENTAGYWKFEESGPPYESVTGSLPGVCDAGGSCPTQAEGIVGKGQQFSGTSTSGTRVNLPGSAANWAKDDSFTITFWARFTGSCTNHANSQVAIGRDHQGGGRWWLGCNRSNGRALFQLQDIAGGGPSNIIGGDINDGNWHFVVGVRDGVNNQNHLYVNGNLIGSSSHIYANDFFVAANPANPINVGWINHFTNSSRFQANGVIDEVAIFNRALAAAEIQLHYQAGLAGLNYGVDNWTVANGTWNDPLSWYGDDAPGNNDHVAVRHENSLTANETAACVQVTPGASLGFGGHELTVNEAFNNRGTVRQSKGATDVNTMVEFLRVGGTSGTLYRGAEITPTVSSLGTVTVTIRAADFDNDDYCTTTGEDSPPYAERCFTITADSSNNEAVLRLYAHTDELGDLLVTNLRPYRFNGTWTGLTDGLATGTAGDFAYAQATTPGFSNFLLGGISNPTAVLLAQFSAQGRAQLPSAPFVLLFVALVVGGTSLIFLLRSNF